MEPFIGKGHIGTTWWIWWNDLYGGSSVGFHCCYCSNFFVLVCSSQPESGWSFCVGHNPAAMQRVYHHYCDHLSLCVCVVELYEAVWLAQSGSVSGGWSVGWRWWRRLVCCQRTSSSHRRLLYWEVYPVTHSVNIFNEPSSRVTVHNSAQFCLFRFVTWYS